MKCVKFLKNFNLVFVFLRLSEETSEGRQLFLEISLKKIVL